MKKLFMFIITLGAILSLTGCGQIERTCDICESTFMGGSEDHFCSNTCMVEFRNRVEALNEPVEEESANVTGYEYTCFRCEETYTDETYFPLCSKDCDDIHNGRTEQEVEISDWECVHGDPACSLSSVCSKDCLNTYNGFYPDSYGYSQDSQQTYCNFCYGETNGGSYCSSECAELYADWTLDLYNPYNGNPLTGF